MYILSFVTDAFGTVVMSTIDPQVVYNHISGGSSVDSRGGYISKILYVKTKQSGPLGGVRGARPLDPPIHI